MGGREGVLDAPGDEAAGRHFIPVLSGPIPDRLDLVPRRRPRALDHSAGSWGSLRCDAGVVLHVFASFSRNRAAFAALRSISKVLSQLAAVPCSRFKQLRGLMLLTC